MLENANQSPSHNSPQSGEADNNVSIIPEVDFIRVRFAGDSGDGIQVTGTQFADVNADYGNDFATFPDYPAEIRAPVGTTYGVSSYSINIGHREVNTFGDRPDILVAMNPAALKTQLQDLREGGLIILDSGTFNARNLQKAGYEGDPREGESLKPYRVLEIDISDLTLKAVKDIGLGKKDALRCKNMWTLGLVLWMFGRSRDPVKKWLNKKFGKLPDVANSNIAALDAGHIYGETMEIGADAKRYDIQPAHFEPGTYRSITGSEALASGLIAAAKLSNLKMFFGSYPITPASPILHALAKENDEDIVTFQAEDEIAAICSAIGASYGGMLGVTSSSGPGLALKTEAMGLAISTELPLLIVDVQRGGPSTGLPTKTEQSDLFQAVLGRNGDAPVPVIAASGPGDCFRTAVEAARMALRAMTPVIILSDGYISNMAEPWQLPDLDHDDYAPFPAQFVRQAEGFHPYKRSEDTLGRNWAIPGTLGLEHRIGGLEKDYDSGNVSYDPDNHQKMTNARTEKIDRLAKTIPPQSVDVGEEQGPLAIVGWGSTYGAIRVAVKRARKRGLKVSHIHLRHIWPLPENLESLLEGYDKVLIPEMNNGQLVMLLRSQYKRAFLQLNKVSGQPFQVGEMTKAIDDLLET